MNAAGTRRWGLAFGWLVTTALAVGLALTAVGAVSDSVTENRPEPLSAAAVSAALAEGTGPEGEAPTATTGSSGPAPTSATTQRPPASAPPTTRGASPSATTRPPAPGTTTASTAPVPSTTQTSVPGGGGVSAPPEERSYEMVGGTVRVRFADGRAELLSATPHAGFRVSRNSGDSGEVRVNFRSDDHESRFRAWWENGPREEIEEKRR